jgi:RNA polymerase sigma factor (TIGR02999 family)
MSDVTQILNQIESGDPKAAEQLLPLVYDELRKLAAAKLAHEKPGQTLQATALVHEAYLRLVGGRAGKDGGNWNGRGHFFGAAAEAMRRILVDSARRKMSDVHGGDLDRMALHDHELLSHASPDRLIAIDDALSRLALEDPTAAELVKRKMYTGLPLEDAAATLGISRATAYRHWAYARAWLRADLADR